MRISLHRFSIYFVSDWQHLQRIFFLSPFAHPVSEVALVERMG